MLNEQIGDYQIEQHLAQHEVSDLYLARHTTTNTQVFIEISRPSLDQNPDLIGRFQRRVETVALLKHPHIAPILDKGLTPAKQAYAIIQHIPGPTLATYLAENKAPLSTSDALTLIRPIADALTVAHPAGIIHQDLRPQNIILQDGKTPFLIDLAVPIATTPPVEQVQSYPTSGRPMLDYASPEQLHGKALSGRSNIYSLGIILYELLAGHRPELPVSQWDIFERTRQLPAEIPLAEVRPGLPTAVYQLVQNCLWRQEWNRFETAESLLAAMDAALVAKPDPPPPFFHPAQRRQLFYGLAALGILVLLILAFLWLRNRSTTTPNISPNTIVFNGAAPGSNLGAIPLMTIAAMSTAQAQTTIELLAPPPDSTFSPGDVVAFDWSWPEQLPDGQQFAVYLISADSVTLLGDVTLPVSGDIYRLQLPAREITAVPGLYVWQVALESQAGQQTLAASNRQRIVFISGTATATPFLTRAVAGTPTRQPTSTLPPVLITIIATETAVFTSSATSPPANTSQPATAQATAQPPTTSPTASRTTTPTTTVTPSRTATRTPLPPTFTATPLPPTNTPIPPPTDPPPTNPPPTFPSGEPRPTPTP